MFCGSGHQKKIAIKTLKMPDAMAGVMGPPTKAQARAILKKFGYSAKRIAKLEEAAGTMAEAQE